tara:strand:- start:153 stop:335 length:183 start_codon:yes stop_codon:yes gene_type:complete
MVAFAQAKTRFWLSKILYFTAEYNSSKFFTRERSKEIAQIHLKQKERFLEASKNGGTWLS